MKHLLLFIFSYNIAFAGTQSGGGGGVALKSSSPVLIDFLNIDPDFHDSRSFESYTSQPINADISLSIDDRSQSEVRDKYSPFALALDILESWAELDFDFAGMLTLTSFKRPVTWQFLDSRIAASPYVPSDLNVSEPYEVAGYYSSNGQTYKVQIDRLLWNKMGVWTQSGLLVHEALRHVQIGHLANFDELSLQLATGIFMMCKPTHRLNYYVQYLIMNGAPYAEKIYGSFSKMIHSNCDRRI